MIALACINMSLNWTLFFEARFICDGFAGPESAVKQTRVLPTPAMLKLVGRFTVPIFIYFFGESIHRKFQQSVYIGKSSKVKNGMFHFRFGLIHILAWAQLITFGSRERLGRWIRLLYTRTDASSNDLPGQVSSKSKSWRTSPGPWTEMGRMWSFKHAGARLLPRQLQWADQV